LVEDLESGSDAGNQGSYTGLKREIGRGFQGVGEFRFVGQQVK
jgi:hypothetical protein